MTGKFDLRQELRHRRRSLSPREAHKRASRAASALARHRIFTRARRIACYVPVDGEVDTMPLVEAAWHYGKAIYLPVLAPFGGDRLWFRHYRPETLMRANRFGIPEPARRGNHDLKAKHLDLVIAPLVAFDGRGHRLGMGGGFYDRSFAYLHRRLSWQRPRIVGLAYEFQRVDALPAEPWDVPLWGVATEQGVHRFANGEKGSSE